MKAISESNSKEIKHENDLDFSVYAVIRLFSIIDIMQVRSYTHICMQKLTRFCCQNILIIGKSGVGYRLIRKCLFFIVRSSIIFIFWQICLDDQRRRKLASECLAKAFPANIYKEWI